MKMSMALSCLTRGYIDEVMQATCQPSALKIDHIVDLSAVLALLPYGQDAGHLIYYITRRTSCSRSPTEGFGGNWHVSDALPDQIVSQVLYNQCAVCRPDALRVDAYHHG